MCEKSNLWPKEKQLTYKKEAPKYVLPEESTIK